VFGSGEWIPGGGRRDFYSYDVCMAPKATTHECPAEAEKRKRRNRRLGFIDFCEIAGILP